MDIRELASVELMNSFAELATRLAEIGVIPRLNRNRQTLVSLRHQKDHTLRLSMHHGLLEYPDCMDELFRFAQTGGRGRFPRLQLAMNRVYYGQCVAEEAAPAALDQDLASLPRIGRDYDFVSAFDLIYEQYFADLPKPGFGWQRSPGKRQLRSIRFGAYYSDRKTVYLNPRLQQPWIAEVFVHHILHHELCHHRQYQNPIRGETSHSKRFKRWEAAFPSYDQARRWEKAYLKYMLMNPDTLRSGLQETFLDLDNQ